MSVFVYMLRCGDGSLYTGWTDDLEKRVELHQKGKGAKYTRGRGPLQLVWHEEVEDKSTALKREIEIKKWNRSKKEEWICKYGGLDFAKK